MLYNMLRFNRIGRYPLSVTNTYNVTKVAINEDLEPIKQFAKRISKDTLLAMSNHRSSQSQVWSQNSSSFHHSPYQKLMSKAVVLPLEEIVKLSQITFCATMATTKIIIALRYG
ncbi:hypothetical protein RYX36_009554 [Vicia faba]